MREGFFLEKHVVLLQCSADIPIVKTAIKLYLSHAAVTLPKSRSLNKFLQSLAQR